MSYGAQYGTIVFLNSSRLLSSAEGKDVMEFYPCGILFLWWRCDMMFGMEHVVMFGLNCHNGIGIGCAVTDSVISFLYGVA